MTLRVGNLLTLLLLVPSLTTANGQTRVMTPRDVLAVPVEKPDRVIRYGAAPSQYGELRVPEGPALHPLVVLIHGGCWRNIADPTFMGAMADALKRKGIATWNIEYRRLPEPGSGWPGTYLDVADAIDYVRALGPQYRLDLTRVVVLGHSAGGHLAHWAAARSRLGRNSPLFRPDPFKPVGIINLAGRTDMAAGIEDYEQMCRSPVVTSLLGGTPASAAARYAEVSPIKLLPIGVPQVLIWGERENFVPTSQVRRFVAAARKAGDDVTLVTVPNAGHFESANPRSVAWPVVERTIERLLNPKPGNPASCLSATGAWHSCGA